jgi:hypothetical protein
MMLTVVNIYPDAGADELTVIRSGANVEFFENEPATSPTPTQVVPYANLSSVYFYGGTSGASSVTIDYTGGNPVQQTLYVEMSQPISGFAPNSLNLVGLDNAAVTIGGSGHITVNSPSQSLYGTFNTEYVGNYNLFADGGSGTLSVTGGTRTFSNDLGNATSSSVAVSVASGAIAQFAVTQHLASLNIASGGTVDMLPYGGQALDTNTLYVGGVLDLANNDLLVNTPSSADMTTLQEQVATGYNYVSSNTSSSPSPGTIFSSTAAAEGRAVGVAPEADISLATLDGQTVPSTALVARFTAPGDLNLDGTVNSADLGILLTHYNATTGTAPPAYYDGDMNYDGVVNYGDFGFLLTHYNLVAGDQPSSLTAGVPYNVTLPATTPQGTPEIWDFSWGDGSYNSYGSSTASFNVSHTYTTAGSYLVQYVAVTQTSSGTYGLYNSPTASVVVSAASATNTVHVVASLTPGSTGIFAVSSDGNGNTIVTENGTTVGNYSTGSLLSLSITSDSSGSATVDYTNGDPLPASGLFTDSPSVSITGGDGDDTLVTATTSAVFENSSVPGSQIFFNPGTRLTFADAGSGDTVAALSGNVTISGDGTSPGPQVIVDTGATAYFSGSITLSGLTILPGGLARMQQNGTAVLTTAALDLAPATTQMPGGILDLANNDLILQSGDINNATSSASAVLAAVTGWLVNGYDFGSWDDLAASGPAPAAIISDAVNNSLLLPVSLGVGSVGVTGGPQPGLFDGVPVIDGDVLVRFTYPGDLALNGTVTASDTSTITANIGTTQGWTGGDITYESGGVVSSADADAVYYPWSSPLTLPAMGEGQSYVITMPGTTVEASTPLTNVASWTVNWGNGIVDSYAVTGGVINLSATAPYTATDALGMYDVQITAYGTGYNNLPKQISLPHLDVVVTPDAPTGLTATESTTDEVDLSWSDDTAVATGYVVTATPSNTSLATKVYDVPAGIFDCSATGLTADAVYAFNVVAVNTLADGNSSASASATTTAVAPASIISAGPATIAEGTSTYTLSMNASTPSGSYAPISYFLVSYSDSPSGTAADHINYSAGATVTDTHTITATETSVTATIIAVDAASNSFTMPAFTVAVVPTAPDTLTGVVASSTEVDLTWVDHSANAAFGDIVYASTDGGATFTPLTEVNSVAAGATNTYAATDLTPGTPYEFYVTADDGYAESSPSNTITAPTTFVPPDIDVEDTGTVVEGQPYELDLTATFEDGEPDAITHWIVNWNDGSSAITYAASSDPTVALAVYHTFATGTSTATPVVTAVDAASATFTATADMVIVTPLAPVFGSAGPSGNSINVAWTNSSSIVTDNEIALSSDSAGANVVAGADAPATATSFNIADLDLDTQYWVSLTATDGDGGFSDPTTPVEVTTPYVAPTLDITPDAAPTESGGYSLNMSASYADGTPSKDLIDLWSVDWGDGRGVQTYAGQTAEAAGEYAATATGATVSITATDGNGHTYSQTESVVIAPSVPYNLSATPSSGDTSATVTFTAGTNISGANYVVERFDPVFAAWSAIATLPATADGAAHTYTYVDNGPGGSGLTPAPGGVVGAYLYRVAAQGAGVTATSANSAGLSFYTPAVSLGTYSGLGGPPTTTIAGTWSPNNHNGATNSFTGSQTFFSTVNLPAHMGYNLSLGVGGGFAAGGTATLAGPNGLNLTEPISSGFVGFNFSSTDQNATTSLPLTLTVNCASTSDTYYVGNVGVISQPGSLYMASPGTLTAGSEEWVTVSYSGTSSVAGITLNAVSTDPSVFEVVGGSATTDASGDATFEIEGVGSSSATMANLVVTDAAGGQADRVVYFYAGAAPILTVSATEAGTTVSQVATSGATAVTDLYAGVQSNGTAKFILGYSVTRGSAANISWSISPNSAGEVTPTASDTFANGAVTVTLNPGDNNYTLTATDAKDGVVGSAIINIHLVDMTAATENAPATDGGQNTPGNDLPKAVQQSPGVYLPVDSVHEDYNVVGTTDYSNTPDKDLPSSQTVTGNDDELMKITLHPVGGNNPGTYTLEIPSTLRVWRFQDLSDSGTNVVTSTTTFNAGSGTGTTLWVQGINVPSATGTTSVNGANISTGTNTLLYVDWTNGAAPINHADAIKVTTFAWSGPEDVPKYGIYEYTAKGLPGSSFWNTSYGSAWNASSTAPGPSSSTSQPVVPVPTQGYVASGNGSSDVKVQWEHNSDTQAAITIQADKNYSWAMHVNVITITVTNTAASFTPTKQVVSKNVPIGGWQIVGVSSGAQTPGDASTAGMQWQAQVNATAPNGHGLNRVGAGEIQNITNFVDSGTYTSDNKVLQSTTSQMGISKTSPILDTADGGVPWYVNNTPVAQMASTFAGAGVVLQSNDTPGGGIPVTVGKKIPADPAENLLVSFELQFSFEICICAETLDGGNNAQAQYPILASAAWSFGGTAKLDAAKKEFAQAELTNNVKVTVPKSWTLGVPNGSVPKATTQKTFQGKTGDFNAFYRTQDFVPPKG